jgi:glucose-1-phosphate cytidylyltransferase
VTADRTLPPVVVLCGGRGTRAWPLTRTVPKPLLPLAGVPALRHLLEVFAQQGARDVVLAAGYLVEDVEGFAADLPPQWRVRVVDTGADTGTGERLRRVAPMLGGRFLATYGDGLGNVDLRALLVRHRLAGGSATVTAVPLRSQYGCLETDEHDRVVGFREKPVVDHLWINAGFLVFEPRVFDDWPGPDLERDVLPDLARHSQLNVYRHRGFWASMDTAKDVAELDALAAGDLPPWLAPPAGFDVDERRPA